MLTLKQAARQVGTSRSSMHRFVQAGRVSATRADNGMFLIEPSELARAFPAPLAQPAQRGLSQDGPASSNGMGDGQAEQVSGQAQAAALERVIDELKQVIDDLRRDRDRWA